MFRFTQGPGEAVLIGADVRITVVGVRGAQVKVGIEAPTTMPVVREELLHAPRAGTARSAEFEFVETSHCDD